jgi:hypothetical protein
MAWNPPAPQTTLSLLLQRLQLLSLRLERLAAAKQAQRTLTIVRALVPPEKAP